MLIKRKWLAASIVAALGAVGATAIQFTDAALPAFLTGDGPGDASVDTPMLSSGDESTLETRTDLYIVMLDEEPLATYRGGVQGIDAPDRKTTAQGESRIDVRSDDAKRYVAYLQDVQQDRIADLGRAVGRPLQVQKHMQHAVNAVVTRLTADEAKTLAAQPGVALVEAYREYALEGDLGAALIGAGPVWAGSTPGESRRFQGEGVVVGIIDSGINFGSPSFAAVDPVDGYRHANELGAGNYLGTCKPGGVDAGRCNDKLIGGYDFVCDVQTDATNPSLTICNQPTVYREEPGFGDTNSHGTHVASTAAGNRRDVLYKGTSLRISGVAPRANIIGYDACYTSVTTGQGLCPNVSTVASINQAVADGVVDVLNYSIGGGTSPWSDVVSQAFLNAAGAGIYVAAAAGNSGPGPATTGHHQPWVGTTAASQHGRGDFVFIMDVTSPAPVPATLRNLPLVEGGGSPALSASLPATTPLRVSPGINALDDGCAAFAPGSFTGAIAVVRRGTCAFTVKVENAVAAGAIAVVIANNQAGGISPSVPGVAVPVFSLSQAVSNALRDYAAANGNALTASIPMGAVPQPNRADQLAGFSSRGPAANWGVLKPDVTAPGVNILAAIAGTTLTGSENAVGLLSGTSMASPHHAGAAALVRQARPGWTVSEIKSALMMTSTPDVLLEDGATAANPLARGSGRIRVDQAIQAGLVLDETKDRYLAANPATGGNPAQLNLPNLVNGACVERCVFTRTFRNTLSHRQSWSARVEGLSATVTPALFSLEPGATATVRITVHASTIAANSQFNFGTVLLQPQAAGNPNQPVLRMPVAIAVRPPAVQLPAEVSVTAPAGGSASSVLPVANVGGSRLVFSTASIGTGIVSIASTLPTAAGSGYRSSRYIDSTSPPGQYAADDFVVQDSIQLSTLIADGFMLTATPLAAAAQSITWSIYPDAAGVPAGNPETGAAAAVWSYTALPTARGVGTANSTISLDLAAAGQNVTLPPGRYWLVVNARTTLANRWHWFASDTRAANSLAGLAALPNAAGAWIRVPNFAGLSWLVEARAGCGASWLGTVTPAGGQLVPGASTNLMVPVNAAGLAPGRYTGYACVASNDPARPRVAVRVSLNVTP